MEVLKQLKKEKKNIVDGLLNIPLINKLVLRTEVCQMSYFQVLDITKEMEEKINQLINKVQILDINNVKEYFDLYQRIKLKFFEEKGEESDLENKFFHFIEMGAMEYRKSFTDSLQVLLFLEKKTNDQLSDLEKKYISEVETVLLDRNLKTNNLLRAKINEMNSSDEYQSIKFELKKSIEKLCKLGYFKSNSERFLNIDRTKENDKIYKEKNDFGYVRVCEFPHGWSQPSIVIKRILKVSEKNSEKYYKAGILKKIPDGDTGQLYRELYKSECIKYISQRDYSKTRKVNNKIFVQIFPGFESFPEENFSAKKYSEQDLVNNVLIAYIVAIDDRHSGNISSDLRHVDFGTSDKNKEGYESELFFDYLKNNNFSQLKCLLSLYMKKYDYVHTLKAEFEDINEDNFKKYFNEFIGKLKGIVHNNKDKLDKLIQEYKQERGEDLLFSDKGFEFLNHCAKITQNKNNPRN